MRLDPVDAAATEPPFEQLRRQIAARVGSGELPAGTRLPTVRALAAEVGLAVNTVARVYRELEADGVVVTEGRRAPSSAPPPRRATAAAQAARDVRPGRAHAGLGLPRRNAWWQGHGPATRRVTGPWRTR